MEVLNEDGEGGVWFNKNLTYRHPSFTPGSGEFAVSEPEVRALLDTLHGLFNVFAVVSYRSNNNLSAPVSFNSQAAASYLLKPVVLLPNEQYEFQYKIFYQPQQY